MCASRPGPLITPISVANLDAMPYFQGETSKSALVGTGLLHGLLVELALATNATRNIEDSKGAKLGINLAKPL